MAAPLLHIHRWHSDYRVAREQPAPECARATLDRAALRLPEELAGGLASWFASEAGVIAIRDLAFDCEVDIGRDSDSIVARWAGRFARALADALQGDDGVLRFPSTAAYRARFIADLAAGHAWHAWYYRPFAGLQALPAAAAIRTVLLVEPATGRDTLLALPAEAWPALADVLPQHEALRILHGLTQEGGAESDPQRLQALLEPAQRLVGTGASGAMHALAILCAGLRMGLAPTRPLAAWAELCGKLAALVTQSGGNVLSAPLRGEISGLAAADAEGEQELRRMLEAHPQWRLPLADALARVTATASAAIGDTAFAGLALLLPELDELLDDALCDALPRHDGVSPRNLAGWLALAHCAGAPRAARFAAESFWRDFFAIPGELASSDVHGWLEGADAGSALALLAVRAASRARGAFLHVPLRTRGDRGWLRVDDATGIWCEWTGRPASRGESRSSMLAAARRARHDWQYLAIDSALPIAWERFFAQLAQAAMRRFAYRIPGFAGTSLRYLHANFLAARGRCGESGRLRLSRPPLHTLLNFTGVARGSLTWSGPPPRVLVQEYAP